MTVEQLSDYDLVDDPFQSFSSWYNQAKAQEENPEAMILATADAQGRSDARTVLFKGLQDQAFTLYGRETSAKGLQLKAMPFGALVFYWHRLKRQVRVQGPVELMERSAVERYFASRSLESRVASSISDQSRPISSRAELERAFKVGLEQAQKSAGEVRCPDSWQGYLLRPERIEFFLYREHRLNDRFNFEVKDGKWSWIRLQP